MENKSMMRFEIFRGFIAILIAIVFAFIFIIISADDPLQALSCLLIKPIVSKGTINVSSILTILGRTTPIIFTGLATCVMFSANQFNLGAEGVTMLGGFVAVLVGVYLPIATGLHAFAAIIIASICGGIVMLLPALVKVKLKSSEMVTSLMLNYIILYFVLHFLNNNFADRSKGATQTFPIADAAVVGTVVKGTELTYGFFVAIIATVIIAIIMFRTRWGYSIRMIGINESFSKYSGLKVGTIIIASQVIGGALAGMGGAIECLGRYTTFRWLDLPGYGWTGITVAILAKNNPLMVPFAAIFIAYLNRGCELMSIYAGVPSEMIDIVQAIIFLFFAAEQFLSKHRQKLVVKEAKQELSNKANTQMKGENA